MPAIVGWVESSRPTAGAEPLFGCVWTAMSYTAGHAPFPFEEVNHEQASGKDTGGRRAPRGRQHLGRRGRRGEQGCGPEGVEEVRGPVGDGVWGAGRQAA